MGRAWQVLPGREEPSGVAMASNEPFSSWLNQDLHRPPPPRPEVDRPDCIGHITNTNAESNRLALRPPPGRGPPQTVAVGSAHVHTHTQASEQRHCLPA